ncbi:unnamed protein product [Prorocentrum cordatum]|uniref:Nuclear transcription factor Y subunit n=1 Tax=Prorocentrum cordatum TaxID=2364126 RepID=A0ABN9QWF1_9DINO|nr:unnamed protein product [Polarella glacialis]
MEEEEVDFPPRAGARHRPRSAWAQATSDSTPAETSTAIGAARNDATGRPAPRVRRPARRARPRRQPRRLPGSAERAALAAPRRRRRRRPPPTTSSIARKECAGAARAQEHRRDQQRRLQGQGAGADGLVGPEQVVQAPARRKEHDGRCEQARERVRDPEGVEGRLVLPEAIQHVGRRLPAIAVGDSDADQSIRAPREHSSYRYYSCDGARRAKLGRQLRIQREHLRRGRERIAAEWHAAKNRAGRSGGPGGLWRVAQGRSGQPKAQEQ